MIAFYHRPGKLSTRSSSTNGRGKPSREQGSGFRALECNAPSPGPSRTRRGKCLMGPPGERGKTAWPLEDRSKAHVDRDADWLIIWCRATSLIFSCGLGSSLHWFFAASAVSLFISSCCFATERAFSMGVRIWLTASLAVSSVIFRMAPFSGPGSFLSEQPQKAPLTKTTKIRQTDRMLFKPLSLLLKRHPLKEVLQVEAQEAVPFSKRHERPLSECHL